MKYFVLSAAIIVFAGPALAGDAVQGQWAGPVTQRGAPAPYSVRMTLTREGGETYYPELACGGALKRIASSGPYVFYRETITANREKCVDGTITVAKTAGGLGWNWFGVFEGQMETAYADLMPAKAGKKP